jgi:hypothetical protein
MQKRYTYHRPLETLRILLELLHRLVDRARTADNGAGVADVVEDGHELVGRGRLLVDIEVEFGALALVLGGSLADVGRDLLQQR